MVLSPQNQYHTSTVIQLHNWSEEKGKKETKKSCKNYDGVADLGQTLFKISDVSQQTARSPMSELEPLPKEHWCQVHSAVSSANTAGSLEAV